jgi:hypothetical protein
VINHEIVEDRVLTVTIQFQNESGELLQEPQTLTVIGLEESDYYGTIRVPDLSERCASCALRLLAVDPVGGATEAVKRPCEIRL